tara:strand:- start:540 stop:689 length:150 start_codon:yes stop_codon:yes gene_type:complete
MIKILKKLRELKNQITKRKNHVRRVRVKGMGLVVLNPDGSHADVSKWKN